MEPLFKHDCSRCLFLGHYDGYDLYICLADNSEFVTLICRFGNEEHEYLCGMEFGVTSNRACFRECLIRALNTEYRIQIVKYFEYDEFPERIEQFRELLKKVDSRNLILEVLYD